MNTTLASIVTNLISFINELIVPVGGVAILLFFGSGFRFFLSVSDSKAHAESRTAMIWSFVGVFVLFSIGGILTLIENAFISSSTTTTSSSTTSTGGTLQTTNTQSSFPSFTGTSQEEDGVTYHLQTVDTSTNNTGAALQGTGALY